MSRSDLRNVQKRGIAIVTVVVSSTLMLGVAALVVDVSFMHSVHTNLRRAADAASLAGVSRLPDTAAVLPTTLTIAQLNLPGQGTVLADEDVVVGNWNPDTRSFTPLATPENAVQVTVRRAEVNDNPVSLFFASFLGITESNLSATAVALAPPPQKADIVPVALPVPGFGPIDPNIFENNPGKSGPSEPFDGMKFQIGEEVALFIFGKGKQSPVHLVLDTSLLPGGADTDGVLSGEVDPVPISIGEHTLVIGEGTGQGGFGGKLENRMTDGNTENDTIIVPIIDTLPGSRDADGQLSGNIEVVDFAAVTLTEIREFDVVVVDADGGEDTITIRVLFGDITRRAAGTGDGNPTTGGEYSDSSVLSLPLLVQ